MILNLMTIYIGFIMLHMDSTLVLRRYIVYYINLYRRQITQKVGKYLDSKKLMLDDWLKSVKDGRRDDILCVYLLSMATGTHTAVHLSDNRVWSTLEVKPTSHDDLMRQCNKHLVYLGLGVFLQLKERATVNVLGTVTGQDPELSTNSKKRTISGRPTQRLISKISTFTIRSHNLHRCKQKLSLKCRIKRCTLAYVSFNTFKDLNAHHHIYHPSILFKCPSCGKLFATPSTWKNHKYGCTRQKLFKCNSCKK